jgi:hypothetical protein
MNDFLCKYHRHKPLLPSQSSPTIGMPKKVHVIAKFYLTELFCDNAKQLFQLVPCIHFLNFP